MSTFLDLILAFELYWKHKLFYSTILLDWVNRNDQSLSPQVSQQVRKSATAD